MCCHAVLSDGSLFVPPVTRQGAAHVRLDPDPRCAFEARRFVAGAAAAAVSEEAAEVLALLTSEVVSNAIVHAATPLEVGVHVLADEVVVAVADGAPARPETRHPAPDATAGRGLLLVGELARRWGVLPGDAGKTTWFTLSRVAS